MAQPPHYNEGLEILILVFAALILIMMIFMIAVWTRKLIQALRAADRRAVARGRAQGQGEGIGPARSEDIEMGAGRREA